MYDIFLSKGCRLLPDLSDLAQQVPNLASPQMAQCLLNDHPGFLGLDLSLDLARPLIKRLRYTDARALGYIAPSIYRHQVANFTRETAYPLAERALKQKQLGYPNTHFAPVVFASEDLMWFKFCAVSEEWIAQGFSPGALFVCVDKLDGHIWQHEEFELLSEDG